MIIGGSTPMVQAADGNASREYLSKTEVRHIPLGVKAVFVEP